MEIKASELRKGVEVDLPVIWYPRPPSQATIKYIAEINRYVIADISTGSVQFMSETLAPVVAEANNRHKNINDTAVED